MTNPGALHHMLQDGFSLACERGCEIKPAYPAAILVALLINTAQMLMLLEPWLDLRQCQLAGHAPVVMRGMAK